ncbi:Ribosomal protein L2 [Ceratobasidium theobromae]|uniref:Large ribosomal subunit protein uL2m n=1 Tax=Ceratobasidium theobromae TaxID=1582974 RepID=A0A5N5QEC1_9AGAM|nr:Ribosomal protein L2 [Ceratobasidium theobromae]
MFPRLGLAHLSRAFSTTAALLSKPHLPKRPPSSLSPPLQGSSTRFKTYKPVTPALRHLRLPISQHLFQGRPLRALTVPKREKAGRGRGGRVVVRSRGGGHKQRLRIVDFMRTAPGPHDVVRIEYDPGRSAHIALIKSRDHDSTQPWSYILACDGLRAGDVVESFRGGIPDGLIEGFVDSPTPTKRSLKLFANPFPVTRQASLSVAPDAADLASAYASMNLSLGVLRARTLKPGNVLPLRLIPAGTLIHAISLSPTGRASLVRSAGTFAQVVAHDEKGLWTQVRLQSGEVRNIMQHCAATIGKVSNPDWKHRVLGKAGRSRWLGRRPHVRGVAMNACDHPHGGGRGKSKGGKHPRSVWGWLTKGRRTRRSADRDGNKFVVKERPRGIQ